MAYAILLCVLIASLCSAQATQVITVLPEGTPPPLICIPPPPVVTPVNGSTTPDVTGVCNYTNACPGGPPSLTYVDTQTILGGCPCNYTIVRTWTVVDFCGVVSTSNQTIRVFDATPPTMIAPADVTIPCTASRQPSNTGQASASDNCDPNPVVTYSDVVDNSTSCPFGGSIMRTWKAKGTNSVALHAALP